MAIGSVDRLEEIPDRLEFLFEFDAAAALDAPDVAEVMHEAGARDVIAALRRRASVTPLGSIARRFARRRTASRSAPGRRDARSSIRSGWR